jgi:Uma2 family endonuclease
MAAQPAYDETIVLPRAIRFPVELVPPPGFDPERLDTWPVVPGRLEHMDGRLLFMPPCGDVQQDTVADVVITLGAWVRANPSYVLGTNEAGMRLAGATRAADAAIWRRSDVGPYDGRLRRRPPVLAVEVAGDDEPESFLCDKGRWYLDAGVVAVWLVLPETREVIVMTAGQTVRFTSADALPENAALPGLAPRVSELFTQLGA